MSYSTFELGRITKKIGSGVTPRGGDSVYVDSGVALVRSQNVYNLKFHGNGLVFLLDAQADRMRGVELFPEDVLLNITGDSVARCCVVPEDVLPARVNQHVAIIRPKPEVLRPRFLAYYLVSPFMQATMLSLAGSGGTRKALTKGMIERFKIPCPTLDVQDAVCATLSAYDGRIENNRRRIELLEQSARELYKEWFVRFRFPGHEHVKIVDGVPYGWDVGTIADFFDTTSGGTPSRKVPEFYTGDINWVKTQELHEGFIFSTEEKITEEAIAKSSAKLFPSDTLLVSIYGGTNIGRTGILASPAASNQACCALFPKDIRANYIYASLYFFFQRPNLIALAQGAAQTNISQQVIRKLRIVFPSEPLMAAFIEELLPVYEQHKNLELQNIRLVEARDLLLPKLMSGELAA